MPASEISRPAAHALLHATVLLWGATAILGHQISIHAISLVWYRLIVVVVVMLVLVPARGLALRVPAQKALRYATVGAFIGLHWVCFYGAIKQAGVSTAVLTLSTITFFTAIIEPIVFRRRVAVDELLIGAVVVGGVALLVRVELHADPLGLLLGLGSALLAAVFGVLNGRIARDDHPSRLMLYEMVAALVVVTACFVLDPSQFVAPSHVPVSDLGWLVILGVACTVVPQIWVLIVLRVLSPFTVAVTVNLEPVYALVLAAILFRDAEPLTLRFCAGAALLLGLVVANAWRVTSRARRARDAAAHPA